MRYELTLDGVTISSDNRATHEKVFQLLMPHFTQTQLVAAALSMTEDGVRVDKQLARDMLSDDPKRRAEAVKVLKAIHQQ
jgi:hypothetical protein